MSGIFLPRRWKKKPSGPVKLNGSSELTSSLLFCHAMTDVKDLVGNCHLYGSNMAWKESEEGRVFSGGAGLENRIDVPAGDFSLFLRFKTTDHVGALFGGRSERNDNAVLDVVLGHNGAAGCGPGRLGWIIRDEAKVLGYSDYEQYPVVNDNVWHTVVLVRKESAQGAVLYLDGLPVGGAATHNQPTGAIELWNSVGNSYVTYLYEVRNTSSIGALSPAQISLGGLATRAYSDAEIYSLHTEPWQLIRRSPLILYSFPSAGGGGATGTGAPAAQSATVAGTATRTVTGSGAPAAQAATASGTAEREITSSGTPAAQSATVSGTGTVGAVVTGSGAPQAQSATVAGTAEREVTASGTPSAQSATVAGTAEREITSSGTPTAQSATVVGTGQVGNIITGSGTPTAQSATVSGTAEREITASGTISASAATVVGTAERTVTGTGTLSASSATVYGFDSAPVSGNPTSGGGTGKVYSSKKLRKEVDEWLEKQQESERQKFLARLQREDEELMVIMLALAA